MEPLFLPGNIFLWEKDITENKKRQVIFLKRLLLLLTAFIMILSISIAFAEEDPDAVIREWEEKYGDQRLWDYQVNAAFAEHESWRYAWNPSMRPTLPDPDAIPAEDAEKLVVNTANN